jgi:hypothetical protein
MLADDWIAAYRDYERAKERLETVAAQILPTMAVGDVLAGTTGKVRKCDRGVLKPEKLRLAVSTSLWTSITERKPVAALYKAAVRRGTLSEVDLEKASDRSKPWLELM